MIERNIMLTNLESVKSFVQMSAAKDYDVDVSCGKYIVNAKSLMGIFSLDLTKTLHVTAYCDENDSFGEEIKQFVQETGN